MERVLESVVVPCSNAKFGCRKKCFREPHGISVIVSCVAPSALEVGEFSCHISAVEENYNMTFELPKVKRVRELSLETPEDDFMLVPSYFLRGRQALKVRVCIRKLNQE
ncbi:unnamed protein product [Microthlaspi erraticum]|uniref:Uncharacterized protein n=1 Tax=Microthlaspi erraticum TaxID=1685480 RepID=A0A6D2KQR1_9BRAS|nr:unnamed protein product [Microthlaspi erraticum]